MAFWTDADVLEGLQNESPDLLRMRELHAEEVTRLEQRIREAEVRVAAQLARAIYRPLAGPVNPPPPPPRRVRVARWWKRWSFGARCWIAEKVLRVEPGYDEWQ